MYQFFGDSVCVYFVISSTAYTDKEVPFFLVLSLQGKAMLVKRGRSPSSRLKQKSKDWYSIMAVTRKLKSLLP
jgi:hypothetical protein